MEPRFITIKEKSLVGISTKMSFFENKTEELWKSFRIAKYEISDQISTDFISLQQYPEDYFDIFNPTKEFVKWACVEVANFDNIPLVLNTLILPGGLYAVFDFKGSAADTAIFQNIYSKWLPSSECILDNRPHFEVLGKGYKNNDHNSEEQIWIPVKTK